MRDSGIQDTSCSFGNFSLSTGEASTTDQQEKQDQQATNPIGKEDIRIPIAIDFIKAGHRQKLKLANVAICEITGVIFPVGISPALSLEFHWRSPLATRKNAVKVSFLPHKEIALLPAEYIAGCILSLLSSENLIEDRLKAQDRNNALVRIMSNVQLVDALVLTRKLVESGKTNRFPKVAISFWNQENFQNYLQQCEEIINPPKVSKSDIDLELAEIESRKQKTVTIRLRRDRQKPVSIELDDEDEVSSLVQQQTETEKQRAKPAAQMLAEWLAARKGK